MSKWTLSFTETIYIMQYVYIMCGIWSVSTKYAREWKRHSSGTNFMVESNAAISETLILDNVCEKAKIWYIELYLVIRNMRIKEERNDYYRVHRILIHTLSSPFILISKLWTSFTLLPHPHHHQLIILFTIEFLFAYSFRVE